jgi:hypothetical protein
MLHGLLPLLLLLLPLLHLLRPSPPLLRSFLSRPPQSRRLQW